MTSVKYRILNQISESLDVENIKKLQLLYTGGEEIKRQAERFIPKEINETPEAYKAKLKWATYTNYMANIVNTFAGNIFSKPLTIAPASDANNSDTPGENLESDESIYYREFAENADLQGNSFKSILKKITTAAMVSKFAYIAVDFPTEEENSLNRPYCYEINPLNILDWNEDKFGKFTFLVIKDVVSQRLSLLQDRTTQIIRFTVWKKENSQVSYQIYEIPCKKGECVSEDADVPLIKEDTTDFKEIPILKLEIPEEMWIGNLIGNLTATIFRQKTALYSAMSKNCNPVLIYKQGAEITESGDVAEAGQDVHRGNSSIYQAKSKGALVLGPNDDFKFAEPTGSVYEPLSQAIKDNVDELHRIVSSTAQSVKSTSHASATSGISKQADNKNQEVMIKTFAEQVKLFAKKVYFLISQARNENIIWAATGMEDYRLVDRDLLIKELETITIPSPTFMKAKLIKLVTDYDSSLSESEVMTIKEEIFKSVDKMSDLSELQLNHSEPDGYESKDK
jgi:hypothetical protein